MPVDLEGHILAIEHRKLGLGIFPQSTSDSEEVADRIVNLINRGVKQARPYFEWQAQLAVKGSNINVSNLSSNLYNRLQFCIKQYESKYFETKQMSGQRIEKRAGNSIQIIIPEYRLRTESEWLAISTVESFFSWTEHVFILLAILQGKCLTGDAVNSLANNDWKTKFKAALDINDSKTKYYYDKLLVIREQVRNFVSHGSFGKNCEAFSFHSGAGAAPVRLSGRNGSFSFASGIGFSENEAIELIKCFIEYVKTGPLLPAWIYIDSGLPLILSMANGGEYELAMESRENMEEFTEYLDYIMDQASNMDFP